MRIRYLALIIAMILVLLSGTSFAQAEPLKAQLDAVTETRIDFPVGIVFTASLDLDAGFDSARVELYYRPVFDETLRLAVVDPGAMSPTENGVDVTLTLDLQSDFIPSGIDLEYFWSVTSADSSISNSDPEFVSWSDTRFDWKSYETAQVRLFAYSLSDEFANSVATEAQETVTSLETRFGLDRSETISIWIYANTTDFQAVLQSNSREAVAGVSYPGFLVVKAVLREGDDREVGRTITHEMSHQVLSQATRNPYAVPPLWFDEGMATHAQTSGIDGYLPLAVSSVNSGNLFRLESLTQVFPFQPAEAAIAYAASWSAVEFVLQTWGDEGIARLIAEYASGTPPGDAIENALGMTPDEFDRALREWLLGH
jgi:hypothetical protein